MATFLGIHPHAVAKGRIELPSEDIDPRRIRKAGTDRKAVENDSAIRSRIVEILNEEVAGDPIDGTPLDEKNESF